MAGKDTVEKLNHDKGRYPVLTMILYFGTVHRWDKNRLSLYDVFGERLPEKLKPYINDYKINVFEIAWLSDE